MAGEDLVAEAAAELYAAEPGEFIARRNALAARARQAGAAAAAKHITALRKPTRSAWVLNQLVRADPQAPARLADLGGRLHAAQQSLDGDALRELSVQRRRLVGALARQAFAAAGLTTPPAALRDEVTATLSAALADRQVADRLRAGALDRPARWEGFGSEPAPVLALVPPARVGTAPAGPGQSERSPAGSGPPARRGSQRAKARRGTAAPAAGPSGPAGQDAGCRSTGQLVTGQRDTGQRDTGQQDTGRRSMGSVTTLAAARARAERERRRQALAAAQRELADADRAAESAAAAQQQAEQAVRALEVQLEAVRQRLAGGREELADARQEARRAATAQRRARQALDRLEH
ncbi:MAG: hypothetical protein ACLQDY_23555 [Streptosporangiaceae bacterium]